VRRFAGLVGVVAVSASSLVVAMASGASAGNPGTPFLTPGSLIEFVVPIGVCEVDLEASGATGGSGSTGQLGGVGGFSIRTIDVTPGEILFVTVGSRGNNAVGGTGGAASTFGGGGAGGNDQTTVEPANQGGGGGGGSSDVRQGGTGLANRVIVAGGGGGGAGGSQTGTIQTGGNGGGTSGDPGTTTGTSPVGGGGTQVGPGTAVAPATAGDAGGFSGGTGATNASQGGAAGGGGGGGFFGGGGGSAIVNNTAFSAGGGGGGGSGFADGGTTTTGAAEANATFPGAGSVTIIPIADSCPLPSTLQVRKVVKGDADEGFTVRVSCTGLRGSVDLRFDEDGTPVPPGPAGWNVVGGLWEFQGEDLGTCTATETDDGDADEVRYKCAYTPGESGNNSGCPGLASGPSSSPRSVEFVGNDDRGLLTVINRFEDEDDPKDEAVVPTPPVAQAVVAQASFTG
jgi:hypothetical protein